MLLSHDLSSFTWFYQEVHMKGIVFTMCNLPKLASSTYHDAFGIYVSFFCVSVVHPFLLLSSQSSLMCVWLKDTWALQFTTRIAMNVWYGFVLETRSCYVAQPSLEGTWEPPVLLLWVWNYNFAVPCLACLLFLDRVPCNSGWLQTHYLARD